MRDLLEEAVARLVAHHDTARLDAEVLIGFGLGIPRHHPYAFPERRVGALDARRVLEMVARRGAGEPIAYLTGRREFWSMELQVSPATLIPRPETERLVERAVELLPGDAPSRVLDLGTGSGAIALAIARERPACTVIAVDVREEVARVAAGNAARHRVENVAFVVGDWAAALRGARFHLVVSNPPYVAEDDPHLRSGDARHEPRIALAAGADGLRDIRLVAAQSFSMLVPAGSVLIEHGMTQGEAGRGILRECGYTGIVQHRDYAGLPRVLEGRRPARAGAGASVALG